MIENNLGDIVKDRCALVIVDMQDKLFRVMADREALLNNTLKLIAGIKALKVPIYVTEQYPKGIGNTIEKIVAELGDAYNPIEKCEFSCFNNKCFIDELEKNEFLTDIILIGIETHICVLQTAMDAIKKGYNVHLISDCVSSRKTENKKIGVNRIMRIGGFLSSTETVLFQLLKEAGSETFKTISNIVK